MWLGINALFKACVTRKVEVCWNIQQQWAKPNWLVGWKAKRMTQDHENATLSLRSGFQTLRHLKLWLRLLNRGKVMYQLITSVPSPVPDVLCIHRLCLNHGGRVSLGRIVGAACYCGWHGVGHTTALESCCCLRNDRAKVIGVFMAFWGVSFPIFFLMRGSGMNSWCLTYLLDSCTLASFKYVCMITLSAVLPRRRILTIHMYHGNFFYSQVWGLCVSKLCW